MSAYRPPLQDVPIFDSANFAVNLDAPLTLGEGLNYFLSFPNAQGTQNFTDINVAGNVTGNLTGVASQITTQNTTANLTHYLNFSDSSATGNGTPQKTAGVSVNPSTNIITASVFNGNIGGGSAGAIPYQSATDTSAFLSAGLAGQSLTSNGTSAPIWGNNLGYVKSVTHIPSVVTTTITAADYYTLIYATGTVAKQIVLATPASTPALTPPDGTSITIINKGTGLGTLAVWTTVQGGTNLIVLLDVATNSATIGGIFTYYSAIGWISLIGKT